MGIGSSGRGADVGARVVLRHVTGRDFSEAGCFCAWYAVGYTPAAIVSRVCWRLLMGHVYYRTVVVDAWARHASSCSWLRPRLLRLIPRGWFAACTLLG